MIKDFFLPKDGILIIKPTKTPANISTMKRLIIFGRSPFINKIDLNIDYDKYDVLCINYPIPNIKVHYVVSCDDWVKPILAPKTEWISPNTNWDLHQTREFITEFITEAGGETIRD